MAHIGDVHTDFPVAVFEFFNGKGIIKVLGIGGVDGKSGHSAHITATGYFLGGDAGIQGFGCLSHILRVLIGQAELGQDGVDLGIVLAGDTQHVNHLADGRVGVLGPINDFSDHLVTGPSSCQFVERDEDVGSQEFAVDSQLCEVLHHLQGAHKYLLLAFENFYYFGFGLHAVASSADMYQHTVAVQGMHRVALGNHDGQTVIAGRVHAVLAVAAADEDALSHRRTVHCLVAAWAHLGQETVHGKLLQNLNNEGASLGRIGPHGSRHLFVVEVPFALFIEEVDHPVVVFTTFLFQRLQSTLFCHILFNFLRKSCLTYKDNHNCRQCHHGGDTFRIF